MTKRIIAISGKLGTGKTTLATALSLLFDIPVFNFADAVKAETAAIFHINVELFSSREGKQVPMLPTAEHWDLLGKRVSSETQATIRIVPCCSPSAGRSLEIRKTILSEEMVVCVMPLVLPVSYGRLLQIVGTTFRCGDVNYWITTLAKTIASVSSYIIGDVRFRNEYAWLRQSPHVVLIRVFSPYLVPDGRVHIHESECDLDTAQFDIVANILTPIGTINAKAIERVVAALQS
jgi:hypothetical protein